jgi:hypothetical protein
MLKTIPMLPEWAQHVVFPTNRWVHISFTALLVGGTLFYEFVIPKAIEELKEEQQLSVLGRTRWVFRRIVVVSTVALVLSGCVSVYRQLPLYGGEFHVVRPWLFAHVVLGIAAMTIGIAALKRTRASRHPLTWLRVNFVILLIAIFTAAVARHVRLMVREDAERYGTPANSAQ